MLHPPDRPPRRLVVLGSPVAHSLSPAMQQAALDAAGIDARYEALDVSPSRLADVLDALRREGAAGNVTVPHKEAVFAACRARSAVASRVGAVNTFWVRDGALQGDNTDVAGFDAACVALGVERVGARVVVLGAGGSARAVLVAVSQWERATVTLVGRSAPRVEALRNTFGDIVRSQSAADVTHATLLVNATPVGLRDDMIPLDPSLIPRDACVMDLVYRAGETPWVRACRALGLRASDGREMLLHQGAQAFERWFGVAPDLTVMRAALSRGLAH
jgi:shikimate dehydrogenase